MRREICHTGDSYVSDFSKPPSCQSFHQIRVSLRIMVGLRSNSEIYQKFWILVKLLDHRVQGQKLPMHHFGSGLIQNFGLRHGQIADTRVGSIHGSLMINHDLAWFGRFRQKSMILAQRTLVNLLWWMTCIWLGY